MCIRRETQEKARRSLAFSPVSKSHIHITYMLRQCTSIVYIYKAEHIKPDIVKIGKWRGRGANSCYPEE